MGCSRKLRVRGISAKKSERVVTVDCSWKPTLCGAASEPRSGEADPGVGRSKEL